MVSVSTPFDPNRYLFRRRKNMTRVPLEVETLVFFNLSITVFTVPPRSESKYAERIMISMIHARYNASTWKLI